MANRKNEVIQIRADLENLGPISKKRVWDKVLRRIVFKGQVVVGDRVNLKIRLQNTSDLEISEGTLIVNGRINEETIWTPTKITYPKLKSHKMVEIPFEDYPAYDFIAFKPGVISIKVEFEQPFPIPLEATSVISGKTYTYNKSNFLTQKLVHDYVEFYSSAMLYSTFGLVILNIVLIFLTIFHF